MSPDQPYYSFYKQLNALLTLTVTLTLLATACRTPDVSVASGDLSVTDTVSANHAVPFTSFSYQLPPNAFQEISARIGCTATSKILAMPTASLPNIIFDLKQSSDFYEDMKTKLSHPAAAKPNCRAPTTTGSGLQRLKKTAGGKLTIVIVGGTSAIKPGEGNLADSVAAWQNGPATDDLIVERADCHQDFVSFGACTTEVSEQLEKIVASSSPESKLLIWAQGRGGLLALAALANLSNVRDRTLAIVTVGAPLAGAAAGTLTKEQIKIAVQALQTLTGQDLSMFEKNPVQSLMTPIKAVTGQAYASQAWWSNAAIAAISQDELNPSIAVARLRLLREKNFAKTNNTAIPVFHIASALDLSYLTPFPPFIMRDGRLQLATEEMNWNQLLALLAVDSFREYPLNDGFVALEHAVFPPQLIPAGLSPRLLALFKIDHMSMTFNTAYQKQNELANVGIVDGLLAAMASALDEEAR